MTYEFLRTHQCLIYDVDFTFCKFNTCSLWSCSYGLLVVCTCTFLCLYRRGPTFGICERATFIKYWVIESDSKLVLCVNMISEHIHSIVFSFGWHDFPYISECRNFFVKSIHNYFSKIVSYWVSCKLACSICVEDFYFLMFIVVIVVLGTMLLPEL